MDYQQVYPLISSEEDNTEFNECYWVIRVLGFKVDSYSGRRKDAEAWLKEQVPYIEKKILENLEALGWTKKEK